jgi:hypothetical protein
VTVTVHIDGHGSRTAGGDPPDLMSRYQDHLARKVASSQETREIYERLLSRVASGELDPRALDRGLISFLQLNGPDYADRIADLSVRFLAGLVYEGSRDSAELFDEMAPGALQTTLEPPGLDSADWADWVPGLIAYAERARAAQTNALRVVMDRVASGELDPEFVERTIVERSRHQVSESVTRIAELYVEMLTGLDEANATFGMDYLRSIARREQRPHSIELSGGFGESVRVRLLVANDEAVTSTMRCAITDVRREDGVSPAFQPEVTITPDRFELAPDAEVQVACSLLVTDAFAPDVTYVGELRVFTDTATVLEIPLRVRATQQSITT